MTRLRRLDPTPRAAETLQPRRCKWPIRTEEALSVPREVRADFSTVIANRRSKRRFAQLTEAQLSTVLWNSVAVWSVSTKHPLRSRGPAPSAGGLRSVHLLVLPPDSEAVARYDPHRHSLLWLEAPKSAAVAVRRAVGRFMDHHGATILLFAGDPMIIGSCYRHGESLLWRDSGVLQAHVGISAAACDLAYCCLGATGHRWLPALVGSRRFIGTGVALIGRARPH